VTELRSGFVERILADEFPGLRLQWTEVAVRWRGSPRSISERLAELSSRYRGGAVVAARTKPIPHAYRSFFRHIGLDPDVARIPSERAALARLRKGGFESIDLITDTCLIALVETEVPVWALDAAALGADGLGIRTVTQSDLYSARERGEWLEPGTLAVACRDTVHCLLFGDPLPGHGVRARTKRVALFAIGVDGVPALALEEALHTCVDLLA
jgi:DNA/RNA-binding domain of Phe-tRNA-synthetase-like protein